MTTTEAWVAYFKYPNFLTWIRAEASEINGDGCSGVTGLQVECCHIHDAEFYYGTSSHDAYKLHKKGDADPWGNAKPISFEDANATLRRCIQARSKWGFWSPVAIWRWLGVAYLPKSRAAWDGHRAARAAERVA